MNFWKQNSKYDITCLAQRMKYLSINLPNYTKKLCDTYYTDYRNQTKS